ncbi:CotH kinase family protein [Neolewinella persica]|uniref:CotH kinase family protein n=1 Tax=Neolewinella persica TaxID=70998 RepID=UPI00039AFF88|nr:CotH kinase family protein [Neolewinella persica]
MSKSVLLCLLLCAAASSFAQDNFSSSLPIIIIDTGEDTIRDEPKILARMGIIDNGSGQRNALADAWNEYDGYVGIEGRGSTSQSIFPKIGYGLETRTAAGEDRQVALLGFPEEEDWVLHGPYSDKSLIRSALAYHWAGQIMDYAPRVRMVELVINNDYRGVYLFTEKIKRDKNRVDIKKLTPEDTAGDALTGGYILKLDKFTGENGDFEVLFESEYNADTEEEQSIRFLYHYPKPEDITFAQRSYIKSWMRNFENVLAGDDFRDPDRGYRRFVDLRSFVDFLIINEISRNVDGYRLSSFMYKDREDEGGRLHMGPVWDFNLAFGNANYCGGGANRGWGYNFGINCPSDFWQLPFWWDRLREDPDFIELLGDRWNELRAAEFSDERLNATIDSFVVAMDDAPARNFERWPVIGERVWPNEFVGESYEAEIDYLKNWIQGRVSWMDQTIWSLTPTRTPDTPTPGLSIQPNPTDGRIRILSEISGELFDVRVYDTFGRLMFSNDRLPEGISIDLSPFPAGIYLLQARKEGGQIVTGKVVRR